MADYQRMYTIMFRAAEMAVRYIENNESNNAITALKLAQLICENIYIESDETEEYPHLDLRCGSDLFLGKALDVFIHSFRNALTEGNRFHNGAGAVDYVAGCVDTGLAGSALFVNSQQTSGSGVNTGEVADDQIQGALADRDHNAVGSPQGIAALDLGQITVFVLNQSSEDDALIHDFHRHLIEHKFHTFQLSIAELVVACCDLLSAGNANDLS